MKKNKIHYLRKKFTFGLVTSKKKLYVLQFTMKNPWWIPRYDKQFLEGKYTLFGWLFFYFGWLNYPYTE